MRTRRRFSPVLDALQARIAPSTIAPVATTTGSTQLVSTMDETGSPGSDPTGSGSHPIILTPAPGYGGSTGGVC